MSGGQKQSHTGRNIGIGVLIVVILVGAYLALVTASSLSSGGSGGGIIPTTHTVNIVNGVATVNAGHYQSYQINVPSGATNVQVQGSFTASGGSGNDIIVLLMDSTSYTNWQNGHQVTPYYNSGQLTTSNFDVTLPSGSGTYYLVYSNTFSTFSQKNVNTQANLSYTA